MYLADNDEEIPCETCEYKTDCADKRLECVAVRNWYYSGVTNKDNIGRLKRPYKVFK